MSDYHAASSAKRLELLKETLPHLTRIAVFWRAGHAAHPQQVKDLQVAAAALRVAVVPMHIRGGEDIERAFATMKKERIGAVLMLGDALFTTRRLRVIELALQNRIAAMYTTRIFAQEGGLISYGTDIGDLFRRSATHVDRIFKGAKPGDLPIEQPLKFDLVFNLRTAKAIGVTLPRSVLLRADEVIE
jgi:putative ABC transport system substrate-binding protein